MQPAVNHVIDDRGMREVRELTTDASSPALDQGTVIGKSSGNPAWRTSQPVANVQDLDGQRLDGVERVERTRCRQVGHLGDQAAADKSDPKRGSAIVKHARDWIIG